MTEHQKRTIKGRIIIALHEVLGRKPTSEEIERYFRAVQILYRVFTPPVLVNSKRHSPGFTTLM